MVKLYCPKCMDVYTPKSSRHHHTDGAYFGTGFPHMLFMVHPEYRPKRPANQFVPRFVLLHQCYTQFSNDTKPLTSEKRGIYLFIFVLFFQAVWFQNPPDGLSTPASGSIKFQEPSKGDSLEAIFDKDSGLRDFVYNLREAIDCV